MPAHPNGTLGRVSAQTRPKQAKEAKGSSMRNNKDLREEVSRKLIWDALFSLLKERPFHSISVKNICETAYINRSTFYNHFEDKFDLLRYGLRDVVLNDAGIADKLGMPSIDILPHVALFKYVKQHQSFWTNIFLSGGMDSFVSEVMIESTSRFFQADSESAHVEDALPPEIAAQMYFGAVGKLTTWWLKEGCETPIDQLDSWVNRVWRYGKRVPRTPSGEDVEYRTHRTTARTRPADRPRGIDTGALRRDRA